MCLPFASLILNCEFPPPDCTKAECSVLLKSLFLGEYFKASSVLCGMYKLGICARSWESFSNHITSIRSTINVNGTAASLMIHKHLLKLLEQNRQWRRKKNAGWKASVGPESLRKIWQHFASVLTCPWPVEQNHYNYQYHTMTTEISIWVNFLCYLLEFYFYVCFVLLFGGLWYSEREENKTITFISYNHR